MVHGEPPWRRKTQACSASRKRKTRVIQRAGLLALSGAVSMVLLLTGCGKSEKTKDASPSPAPRAEQPASPQAPQKTRAFEYDAGDPSSYLCDMGATSAQAWSREAITQKKGWRLVEEDVLDHVFAGDAVLLNNKMAIVLRRNGPGAEIYALSETGAAYRALVSPEPGMPMRAMKIVENSMSGVQVEASFKTPADDVTAVFRLTPGEIVLEVLKGPRMERVYIEAETRHAIVPNFFADDMVFTAKSFDYNAILLPIEKFFLMSIDGNASLMMCLCETDRQDCKITLGGSGVERRITGVDIQCVPDKKVWIAFMENPDIWRAFDGSSKSWKPPFEACWRLDAILEGGLAKSTPFALELIANSKRPLIVYPLERTRATPYDKYCMRDIMKNTLGLGPCEYIIQSEGISNDATPHEASKWALKQFEKKKDSKLAEDIKEKFSRMVEHVAEAQERVDAYGKLARDSEAVCKQAEKQVKDIGKLLKELRSSIGGMQDTATGKGGGAKRREQARRLANEVIALIGRENSAAKCEDLGKQISVIGHDQDHELSKCRMHARWLRQQCRMMAKATPQARVFLKQIQEMAEKKLGIIPIM